MPQAGALGSHADDSLGRAYIVFGSLFLMIGVMAGVAAAKTLLFGHRVLD